MSQIKPFKAIRPYPQYAASVAAFPYDVLNAEEARAIGRVNPISFLHVEKSEIDVPGYPAVDESEVFETARRNLQKLLADKILFREEKPVYYIYSQKMGNHIQYGIVATASVREYETGLIKKHEFTRADKERERTLHVDKVGAHTGPVFLTYKKSDVIDGLIGKLIRNAPIYDFTADDGISHTAWIVDGDEDIRAISEAFTAVPALYIADGHHRAAAATDVAKMRRGRTQNPQGDEAYEFFLSVIFPHDQLRIMDYNRVVKDLNGLDTEWFLKNIGETFDVSRDFSARTPGKIHEFGLYLEGAWYGLSVKEGVYDKADPVKSLDASIFQESLLDPVLGIKDPRTDKRIDFIGGIRGMDELERLVDSGRFKVAFSLYPTSLEQLIAVADAGKVMPPKSTWFEPKLRSGLFVNVI
ncbi:MAG: hypothetical protein CSYNP_02263 [Syntrophus sp. SKADARSKE-3]|nr:hypothetical protein [Syntrophus sp. SKADARSKE-3]